MIKMLQKERWSAYMVGLLIGILLTTLFAIGHQIGASSGVARMGALIEKAIAPEHVNQTPYFRKMLSDLVIFNWKLLFLIGLFFGALFSSKISKTKTVITNSRWEEVFGPSKTRRYLGAFVGGLFLLFGARLADGCTSGHAISGGAQLSVTSWVFMLAVFASGIPFSLLVYRKK